MENLILEIHSHSSSSINIPVNLDSLVAKQKSDRFCKNKVKHLHHQQKSNFELDDKGILRKLVCLSHNLESTIVIPRSLVNIIYEYHKCRRHQGITRTVNMVCSYFQWPGMRQSIYQHIRTCKLLYNFYQINLLLGQCTLKFPKFLLQVVQLIP